MNKTKAEKADIKAAHAAAKYKKHPVVRATGFLSEAADQPPLLTICAATVAFGLWRRDRRLAETGVRMLAAAGLAILAKDAVKARVDRTRPHVVVKGGAYERTVGEGSGDGELGSFPSGHTAGAVAVARAVARSYPQAAPAAYGVAGLVAAVQVPRCAHYPSDIGAGALIGLLADTAVAGTERVLRPG